MGEIGAALVAAVAMAAAVVTAAVVIFAVVVDLELESSVWHNCHYCNVPA